MARVINFTGAVRSSSRKHDAACRFFTRTYQIQTDWKIHINLFEDEVSRIYRHDKKERNASLCFYLFALYLALLGVVPDMSETDYFILLFNITQHIKLLGNSRKRPKMRTKEK